MQTTTSTTVDNRDLQRAHERRNKQLHQHGLATLDEKDRARALRHRDTAPRPLDPPNAFSQCAGCGDAFSAATSRLAIAARRTHERKAHGMTRH